MSQPPSHSSRRNPPQNTRRVLRRPHERFFDVEGTEAAAEDEYGAWPDPSQGSPRDPFLRHTPDEEGRVADPFVREPRHEAPLASEENMEARHLSPRQGRKRSLERRRAQKREKAESRRRGGNGRREHRKRAAVEKDFAVHAREEAPAARPVRRAPLKRSPKVWRAARRVLAVVALLCLAQGILLALTAPQFRIQSYEISGINVTSRHQVEAIANHMVGQNVLRARLAPVENQLKKLPAVASVQITRQLAWPPRTAITITERQPLVKVGGEGNWWVVDAQGVPFRRARKYDIADHELYAVTGPRLVPVPGHRLPAGEWRRVVALTQALQEDIEASKRPWNLRRVQFDKFGSASLRVLDGPAAGASSGGTGEAGANQPLVPAQAPSTRELWVRLGDGNWAPKLVRTRIAMDYFKRTGRDAAILDLGTMERPVWTPRGLENQPLQAESGSAPGTATTPA